MSSRKNKVNTKESRKDPKKELSRKDPKKELSRKEPRKNAKKEESRKDLKKEPRKNSRKEPRKNSRKESSRKESSKKDPKQPKKLKSKKYTTNTHYQHLRHVESQTVNTRSVTKAQEEILAYIQELANNRDCLIAHEACVEKFVREKESSGEVHLHVIGNSVTQPVEDAALAWLVELQNIFSEGLTDMGRSYISKVVFDPRHKSLVIVEKNDVIGGICFRMFPMHNFTEIIFVAVSTGKHRQGYGTHMLNHLKDYLVSKNSFLMVTYAAQEAIQFFTKQGFAEPEPELEPFYTSYINTYQGATLMECRLDKGIPYTEFSEVLYRQREILNKLIEKFNASCST